MKMNSMLKQLRQFDSFGVHFTPAINNNSEFGYKSVFGGICTLVLYILSAIYFTYEMYRWMSLSMIPVVTSELHRFDQDIEELLDESNASIQFQIYNTALNNQSLNPFHQKSIILTPILKNYSEGKESTVNYNFSEFVINDTFSPILRLNSKSQYQISFARCVTENLVEGQLCADAELMDQFFDQGGNELQVDVILKIIDPRTFVEKEIKKNYAIIIEEIECQITKISMEYTNYEIYQGFIFPIPENKILVSETVEQTTYGTKQYCSKRFVEESFALLWITTSQTAYLKRMQYPEIGDVLANIGSIISTLFLIEHFILYINRKWLIDMISRQFFSFYYPDIDKIEVKTNIFGKITEAKLGDSHLDPQTFIFQLSKVKKLLLCKFSYVNLIYEVSRLQFLTQSILKKDIMLKSHQVGIKLQLLPISNQQTPNSELIDSINLQPNILSFDDSILLSLINRNAIQSNQIVDSELIPDNDFFEINKNEQNNKNQ